MNTKNAIFRIKYELNKNLNDGITKDNLFEAIDNIVALLKRGEKFEKIVEDLEDFCDKANGIIRINEDEWFTWKLNKIIEKYFPKKEVLK